MAFNIQEARKAGYSDDEINKFLQGGNATPAPPSQSQGFKITDLLPIAGGIAGGAAGGLLGSVVPGAGTAVGGIAGGGLGSAGGEWLRQMLENQISGKPTQDVNYGDVAKEGAFGVAGGAAGEALGKGASLLGKVLGKNVAGAGEEIGMKGLRLSKSQLNNFITKHGEDAGTFLKSEGALGKNAAQITEQHINPLQDQFNAIAKQSGLKADPNGFMGNVEDQVKLLVEAGGSENAATAQNIMNEAKYITEHDLGPSGYDISKIDQLRRTFASKVNWQNPAKATQDYALADALRKTAIDTADAAGAMGEGGLGLKDIGMKLSKYRDLEKAITAQEQLGKGNLPLGITKWLSAIAGSGVGGVPGIVGAVATNAAASSPKVLGGLSSGLMAGGKALESGIPGGALIAKGIGQAGVRGIPSGMNELNTEQTGPDQAMASADTSGAMPTNNPIPDVPAEKPLMTAQQAQLLIMKYPKMASEIKSIYDLGQTKSEKPLNATQQKDKAGADSALRQIDKIEGMIKTDPHIVLKAVLPGSPGARQYQAAVSEAADIILRLRTGATANKEEIQQYVHDFFPQPFDSPATVAYKLKIRRQYLQDIAHEKPAPEAGNNGLNLPASVGF